MAIILDELIIEIIESEKCLYVFDGAKILLNYNCFDFFWIDGYIVD